MLNVRASQYQDYCMIFLIFQVVATTMTSQASALENNHICFKVQRRSQNSLLNFNISWLCCFSVGTRKRCFIRMDSQELYAGNGLKFCFCHSPTPCSLVDICSFGALFYFHLWNRASSGWDSASFTGLFWVTKKVVGVNACCEVMMCHETLMGRHPYWEMRLSEASAQKQVPTWVVWLTTWTWLSVLHTGLFHFSCQARQSMSLRSGGWKWGGSLLPPFVTSSSRGRKSPLSQRILKSRAFYSPFSSFPPPSCLLPRLLFSFPSSPSLPSPFCSG